MCSYIRLGQSNRYWKPPRYFDHPQTELDILSFKKKTPTYKWAMETRGPTSKLARAFMPVLVTSNFDGFRDIQVQRCEIFVIQGQVTPKWEVWFGPKIELDRAVTLFLFTSNFNDDSIKNERASLETQFSHYKTIGNFLDARGQLTP